jgi:hypothetical protein
LAGKSYKVSWRRPQSWLAKAIKLAGKGYRVDVAKAINLAGKGYEIGWQGPQS